MVFIDIKDPNERDRLVADYLATVKNIQHRNEDEKALGLKREVDLETTFNPVVKAAEKSTKAITNALVPLRDEIKTVGNLLPATVSRKRIWDKK